jgi:hypothetical protein
MTTSKSAAPKAPKAPNSNNINRRTIKIIALRLLLKHYKKHIKVKTCWGAPL